MPPPPPPRSSEEEIREIRRLHSELAEALAAKTAVDRERWDTTNQALHSIKKGLYGDGPGGVNGRLMSIEHSVDGLEKRISERVSGLLQLERMEREKEMGKLRADIDVLRNDLKEEKKRRRDWKIATYTSTGSLLVGLILLGLRFVLTGGL